MRSETYLRCEISIRFTLQLIHSTLTSHEIQYSETIADPHNANRGFFFAHVGWLMLHKHPEVIKKGRVIDMTDILADPVVQFQQK